MDQYEFDFEGAEALCRYIRGCYDLTEEMVGARLNLPDRRSMEQVEAVTCAMERFINELLEQLRIGSREALRRRRAQREHG